MSKRLFSLALIIALLVGFSPAYSQTVRISELPSGSASLSHTDIMPIVQGGVTKKATLGDILGIPPWYKYTDGTPIIGSFAELDADWWYSGTGEYSTAINNAIDAGKSATNFAPAVRLKNKSYQLSSAIKWDNRVNLLGPGVGSAILLPDAGINAIELDYVSASAEPIFSEISNLKIVGGKNGIKFGGTHYIRHIFLKNLYIEDPTENCVLIDNTDVQSSIFQNIRTKGGQRGWLVKGVTSANRNTWIGGESTLATEAAMEIDASAVTYATTGPILINFVMQNNYKHGLVLKNVRDALFFGAHWEGNGLNITGGPYANIVVYGRADYPTATLTFEGCTNVATGPNQDNLLLQVKDRYVRGPIYFRNGVLRPDDIVDLGTGLNSGILEYTAFVNDGMYPVTVQGDTAPVHNISENMFINGSFESWNEGTSVAPTGWQLYGAGAAAERVTGLTSPYAVKLTTGAAGHNLRQFGMSTRLKPNTIYWCQLKYSMDAASTAGFAFNFINSSAAVAALFTETTGIAGTGIITKRVMMRTPASFTELTGFNVSQSGAGALVLTIDDVQLTEGIELFSHTSNRYDAMLTGGLVTLAANAASTVVTDPRVTATSIITFSPKTANASAEIGAGGMYVSAQVAGTGFTITHANNAQADRSFSYIINN